MPAPQLKLDPTLVDRLACPACCGDLHLGDGQLVCTSCGRVYPVVDGIPVMIAERAEMGGSRSQAD
jgi:uncharacterized protein YbaR (Trm112 family)